MADTEEPFLREACSGNNDSRCFLEDIDNFRSARDKKRRSLCLTKAVIEHTDAEGTPVLLQLSDVVGARTSSGQPGAHVLEVFAYIPSGVGSGCKTRLCQKQRRAAHLKWLASDAGAAERWATAINNILKEGVTEERGDGLQVGAGEMHVASGPGRRLLVLINPVSGTGGSRSAWEKTLRPMMEQASIDVFPVFSTRGGELKDIIRLAGMRGSADTGGGDVVDVGSLDAFDGIVVLGGDGTLFEVLQGLYARPDCEAQLSRLTLGVVPSGTGNGLAKTISEESGEDFGVPGASFLAAKGCSRKMDLLRTESGDKKYLAFLNVGWGMVSDVDIESEAYRWLGSLRFTVGTVVRIIGLRHYRGRISFAPVPVDAAGNATKLSASASPFIMPPLTEAINGTTIMGSSAENEADGVRQTGEEWVTIEGEFVLADVAQAKYISHDMPMAPASRLGDGLMDLFYVRKGAGRLGMTKMFLAMEKGEHASGSHALLEWHRVRAFRIEPLTSKGRLTVDGELVDYVPLQQHVWAKAANVMCSS